MAKQGAVLKDVIREFHQYRSKRVSLATQKSEFYALNHLSRSALGGRLIANLTHDHIDAIFWGDKGLCTKVSPGTFNLYRSHSAFFFKWAQNKGYVKSNPVLDVKTMRKVKKHKTQPSAEELLDAIEATKNPRDRMLMVMLANTGLRISEVTRIHIGDIDLSRGFFRATILKTGEVDDMPITSELDAELRTYLIWYQAQVGRPLLKTDLLISTWLSSFGRKGEPRMLRMQTDKILGNGHEIVKQALSGAGVEVELGDGAHTVRRGAARIYFEQVAAEKGDIAALRETAALLHHKQTSTTEGYLGMTAEVSRRNDRMKGRPFLSAAVPDRSNVIPLRAVN